MDEQTHHYRPTENLYQNFVYTLRQCKDDNFSPAAAGLSKSLL